MDSSHPTRGPVQWRVTEARTWPSQARKFPLEKCCDLLGACAQPQRDQRERRVQSGWRRAPLSAWALATWAALSPATAATRHASWETGFQDAALAPTSPTAFSWSALAGLPWPLLLSALQLSSPCSCEDPSPAGEHATPVPMDYLLNLL